MPADRTDRRPVIVLADDLSGAAELAGVACGLGLTAEVQRAFEAASEAEVISVSSNSRGLAEADAVAKVGALAGKITASGPAWIFKKVDSLLRGHVRAEIEAILRVTGQRRAILIPANPSRGRVIREGTYYINGVPLDQTALAYDPDYPRRSASVGLLLGGSRDTIHCIDDAAALLEDGIIVPDVWERSHLQQRAEESDEATLAAGAADFFEAILRSRIKAVRTVMPQQVEKLVQLPAILVCGSHTAWQSREDECRKAGVPIVTMNDEVSAAAARLSEADAVVLAIGSAVVPEQERRRLMTDFANFAASVLEQNAVATVLVEGGATAEAVSARMRWSRFAACAPGPPGIGVLQPISDAQSPSVLIKPGSYPWPSEIWQDLSRSR